MSTENKELEAIASEEETAAPEKPCRPLTLVYCSFGTKRLVATKAAGSWNAFIKLSSILIRYRCQTRSAESVYSNQTLNVPHAANRSAASMMRFLSQRSAIAPATNLNRIVGANEQSVSSATLEAVPSWR